MTTKPLAKWQTEFIEYISGRTACQLLDDFEEAVAGYGNDQIPFYELGREMWKRDICYARLLYILAKAESNNE